MSLSFTTTTPTPETEGADSNLPMDIMADSFIGLLVDLFIMLPAGGRQELFATLYKAYPRPLDAKRSKEFKSNYSYRSRNLLGRASTLSQLHSYTFFPREPLMDDLEYQLMTSPFHTYLQAGSPSDDDERAEILQLCRTQCSVSPRHISFVEELLKCLQERKAPLQFQMQLLLALVSNCVHHDWISRSRVHSSRDRFHSSRDHVLDLFRNGHMPGDHMLCDSLLASDDLAFSLEALKDMWKFSLAPQEVLELLEAIQDQAHSLPQAPDIMCDILISLLGCETSLHLRIFLVMLKIGAKPEHILQAVNIVSCSISDSKQSNDQCRATAIRCAETLGASYNKHKASGAATKMLLELRVKAMDFLRHAKSIPVGSYALKFLRQSDSTAVNVQAVKQVVYDSGQQALAELLELMVMLPGQSLLPTLKGVNELCNYYYKDSDTSGDQAKLLKLAPFKESIAKLLENRKKNIEIAGRCGNTSRMRHFLDDLKLSFQFLGDEEGFAAFVSFLWSTDRPFSLPLSREVQEENRQQSMLHAWDI